MRLPQFSITLYSFSGEGGGGGIGNSSPFYKDMPKTEAVVLLAVQRM